MNGDSRERRRARLSPAKQALLQRRLRETRGAAAIGARTRPADETPRLAPEQRGLWTLHRLAPDDPSYHLVSAMRVEGALDVGRLRHALNEVSRRHRILRSGWRPDDEGGAVQVITESADIPLALRQTATGGPDAIRAFARDPFDLGRPPLPRALHVPAGAEPGWLVLALPHLVTDEHGLHTFWRELGARYRGDALGEVPAQFDDIVWARRREPDRSEVDLAYWREQLREPFEPLDVESPSGDADDGAGRLAVRTVDASLTEAAAAFARARDVTPFAVYLAAYFTMLRAWTGRDRLAVGCPVSTRERPDEQSVIGYFLNAVVLTMRTDPAAPFTEAAADVHAAILKALEHRRLPFDRLVEALQPARLGGSPPWFQTMLVMVDEPPALTMGDARLRPALIDTGTAKFDLTWFVAPGGDAPWIGAEFRTARHEEAEVRLLLDRYVHILRQALDRPGRPMTELDALLPAESNRLFHLWQPDPIDLSGIGWVRDQVLRRCRERPGALALRGGEAAWSYGELHEFARRVHAALRERGVSPGDRVALHLDRSPAMAAAILGAHCAGAAYVPLDPDWPAARVRDVYADADPTAVITSAGFADLYPDAVRIDALPPKGADPEPLEASQPAYVMYTSGSTGHPKGVVVTHANVRAGNEARIAWYADTPEVFLLLSGFAFDSSVAGLFWTLATGGTLVIPSAEAARDPGELRDVIERAGVTHLLGIPSLVREVIRNETERLGSLRAVIVAGETCSTDLVETIRATLPAARLVNEYGPTETTVWATAWEDDRRPLDRVPIGRPAPHARVYVLDRRRRPLPPGRAGACWIGGAGVGAGYWRNDALTAERFVPDPFDPTDDTRMYHSGDIVRWRNDGCLDFLGREDEQLKVQGVRLESGEIETALRAVPGVREACVVGARPSAGDGSAAALTAFIVGEASPIDGDRLRRFLRERLPAAAVPAHFVAVSALPTLPNGKVDRAALARTAPRETPAWPEATERDRDPILRSVLEQWRTLLDQSDLDRRDNVFERGAHSLLVIQCAEALARRHGIRIPVGVVFQHPAPYDLANWIRLHQTIDQPPSYEHVFPVHIEGDGAPLFAIQPDFTSGILTEALRGRRPVYGLRGIGFRPEGNAGRWPSLAALADEMIGEIRTVQLEGPYRLSGYSLGAVIAIEVAHRMEAQGDVVARLVVFDPTPWNMVQRGPLRLQLRQCRQPVTELSTPRALLLWLADNRPWGPFLWRRLGRILVATPYRRILLELGRRRRRRGGALSARMMQADSDFERFRLFFRHRPSSVSAPTLFFNARGPDYDAATLWRPYFAGPLDVCDIDTVHQQVGATPATRALVVRRLREVL